MIFSVCEGPHLAGNQTSNLHILLKRLCFELGDRADVGLETCLHKQGQDFWVNGLHLKYTAFLTREHNKVFPGSLSITQMSRSSLGFSILLGDILTCRLMDNPVFCLRGSQTYAIMTQQSADFQSNQTAGFTD